MWILNLQAIVMAYVMILRITVLILGGFGLAGCAATRASDSVPLRNVAWVAALSQQSEIDANRECVRGSLQIAYALLAFKEGKFDDSRIKTMLLDGAPNQQVLEMRTTDFSEWSRTHDVAVVAERHLIACFSEHANRLAHSDTWRRCFVSTEPAAMFSIYRRMGRSESQAIDMVASHYAKSLDAQRILDLGKQIYLLENDANDLTFREHLFASCLGGTQ
jgi:hypothetical protein